MAKPAGKSAKGHNQRNKLSKGKATMRAHFQPEKKPPRISNNSANTATQPNDNEVSSVASICSSRSNSSNGSNNSYSGAVKNTNSNTDPKNLEENLPKPSKERKTTTKWCWTQKESGKSSHPKNPHPETTISKTENPHPSGRTNLIKEQQKRQGNC